MSWKSEITSADKQKNIRKFVLHKMRNIYRNQTLNFIHTNSAQQSWNCVAETSLKKNSCRWKELYFVHLHMAAAAASSFKLWMTLSYPLPYTSEVDTKRATKAVLIYSSPITNYYLHLLFICRRMFSSASLFKHDYDMQIG